MMDSNWLYYCLSLTVAIPFVGRAAETFVTATFKPHRRPNALPLATVAVSAVVDTDFRFAFFDVAEASGWKRSTAVFISAMRLVLWHWMQPAGYAWTLYIFYEHIDAVQQKLALIVLAREALYIALTLGALILRPTFLLVQFKCNSGGMLELLAYTLCPEKYVMTVQANPTLILSLSGGLTLQPYSHRHLDPILTLAPSLTLTSTPRSSWQSLRMDGLAIHSGVFYWI